MVLTEYLELDRVRNTVVSHLWITGTTNELLLVILYGRCEAQEAGGHVVILRDTLGYLVHDEVTLSPDYFGRRLGSGTLAHKL